MLHVNYCFSKVIVPHTLYSAFAHYRVFLSSLKVVKFVSDPVRPLKVLDNDLSTEISARLAVLKLQSQ